jgi:hypothetical protein
MTREGKWFVFLQKLKPDYKNLFRQQIRDVFDTVNKTKKRGGDI